jgi:hypothetical protein
VRVRASLALLAAAALLAACSTGGDAGDVAATDDPVVEQTSPPDGPIPVEGDGGIGGEPGGPVTSNLILPPEQVEVTGTCLQAEDPPTYRLDLAGGGTLTVATSDGGGALTLEYQGRTFTSPDTEPPVISGSDGAISAQGNTVADDGAQQFVDAVIGLDDLPEC